MAASFACSGRGTRSPNHNAVCACPAHRERGCNHQRSQRHGGISQNQFRSFSHVAYPGRVSMQSVYEARVGEATNIQRKALQSPATICSPIFGRICKTIWPTKTAEQLAAEVGCSVRAAAYQISGEHPPSDRTMVVVFNRIFARG